VQKVEIWKGHILHLPEPGPSSGRYPTVGKYYCNVVNQLLCTYASLLLFGIVKTVSHITYNVLAGTLNTAQSNLCGIAPVAADTRVGRQPYSRPMYFSQSNSCTDWDPTKTSSLSLWAVLQSFWPDDWRCAQQLYRRHDVQLDHGRVSFGKLVRNGLSEVVIWLKRTRTALSVVVIVYALVLRPWLFAASFAGVTI